tara:strand:- start:307 stop:642 length:336 start_codon:yes stop_codon:yes gene_type:complete
MASVVDYTKFDKLELSDDEDDTTTDNAPSAAEQRYRYQDQINKQNAVAARGNIDETKGIDPSQKLAEPDEGESSSECDSDIEDNPIFWKKMPKVKQKQQTRSTRLTIAAYV